MEVDSRPADVDQDAVALAEEEPKEEPPVRQKGKGLFRADEFPPVPDSARQPPSTESAPLFGG